MMKIAVTMRPPIRHARAFAILRWGVATLACLVWFGLGESAQAQTTETVAAVDGETSPVVILAGLPPTLGGFGTADRAINLTTATQTIVGALAEDWPKTWSGWRAPELELETTGTDAALALVFAGADDKGVATEPLRAALAELKRRQVRAYVLPAKPDMRLSDIFNIRREVSLSGADFVDLGPIAAGRPYEDALEEVKRRWRARGASGVSGAVAPDQTFSFGQESSTAGEGGPTATMGVVRSTGGPVTTDMRNGERVVMMPAPPAIREFPRTRPVPRDPRLKKMPALSN